jgi:hypothetical protein
MAKPVVRFELGAADHQSLVTVCGDLFGGASGQYRRGTR